MSESAKHMELVAIVQREAATIVTGKYAAALYVDSPDAIEKIHIGHYCPDVYFNFDGKLVIGEAKTFDDFSRKHSQEQFAECLAACAAHEGEAVLIVAVPWMLAASAKNYFRRRKSACGKTCVIILDDTNGRWVI